MPALRSDANLAGTHRSKAHHCGKGGIFSFGQSRGGIPCVS
jgi:hypothetical protein